MPLNLIKKSSLVAAIESNSNIKFSIKIIDLMNIIFKETYLDN